MQSSYDIVADEFSAVNDLIAKQLTSDVGLVENISQYLVTGGGKRIRPLITLLAAGALDQANNLKQIQSASLKILANTWLPVVVSASVH